MKKNQILKAKAAFANAGQQFWRTSKGIRRITGEWTLATEQHSKRHAMEIQIQPGSVETFFQDNPSLVDSLFKGIQSTKAFEAEILTIATTVWQQEPARSAGTLD